MACLNPVFLASAGYPEEVGRACSDFVPAACLGLVVFSPEVAAVRAREDHADQVTCLEAVRQVQEASNSDCLRRWDEAAD